MRSFGITHFSPRIELLYLLAGLGEALWLTPYYMLLAPGAEQLAGPSVALLVGGNLLTSLVIIRFCAQQGVPDGLIQGIVVLGGCASVILTLGAILPLPAGATLNSAAGLLNGLLVALSIGLLWFRGTRLATAAATVTRTSFGLRLGIVGLMLAALIPEPRIRNAVLLLLPLFFFCGLAATALARSASLRADWEVSRSAFGGRWITFTLLMGATLTILGYGGALIISGFQLDGVFGIFRDVFIAAVTLAAWIVYPLYTFLQPLIANFFRNLNPPSPPPGAQPAIDQVAQAGGQLNPLSQLVAQLLPLFCLVMVAALLLIVILARVRNRKRAAIREDQVRESIEGVDVFGALRTAMQKQLDALGDALGAFRAFGLQGSTALTIRRLYGRMVALIGAAGYPRLSAQTPLEYESTAAAAYPAYQQRISTLTRAYVNVHYGELPDDPTVIEEARALIADLEAAQPQDTPNPGQLTRKGRS